MSSSAMFITLLVSVFIVLGSVEEASAGPTATTPLLCYDCQWNSPDCQDPFNETIHVSLLKKCEDTKQTCYKYTNSEGKVQRGCTSDGDSNECPLKDVPATSDKAGLSWCYRCYESDCNSARQLGVGSILILSAFLLVAIVSILH